MIKFSATLLATLIAASVNAATVDLRIMETTDLHSNMMDFDYYKDAATEKFGLVRTASLIEQARAEVKNSVLVDNGDVIQGSPLGDCQNRQTDVYAVPDPGYPGHGQRRSIPHPAHRLYRLCAAADHDLG